MAKLMTEGQAHLLKVKATNDRVAQLTKQMTAALVDLNKAVNDQQKFMVGK